ncbi:MAG: hypothetical protein KDB27_34185 [Planctomycetales bacterium]|nr:hypothetical protein [Planctomycetales bacterium]
MRRAHLLLTVGVVSLVIHLGIFCFTGASACVNQPEFYYNRFVIRDADRNSVNSVSLTIGVLSYSTAVMAVAFVPWGAGIAFQSACRQRREAKKCRENVVE